MGSYLITGTRRGIGRSLAERLTGDGHRVYGIVRPGSGTDLAGLPARWSWTWPTSPTTRPHWPRADRAAGAGWAGALRRPRPAGSIGRRATARLHRPVRGERAGRRRTGPALVAGVTGGGRDGGAGQLRLRAERAATAGQLRGVQVRAARLRRGAAPGGTGAAGVQRSIRAVPRPTCSARSAPPRPASTGRGTTCGRRRSQR